MSFYVREVQYDDLEQLVDLAQQFHLLNLPGNKKILSQKIEKSVQSFAGALSKGDSEYLFVLIDDEEERLVGSSLIMAKHGTDEIPHSYFKILKRDHFSEALGLGFIHQVLRFQMDTDGPTEIGGLLVDKGYRRRPEKLGKQISLMRFNYIATHRDRFEDRILCELTPPLTDEGRSEFWESLGRRFTGLPYQEADVLSQTNKEFIESLFPEDDIYLCLLDAKARLVLGRVGESTKPAQHLLESIGFEYIEEVDPFDGGPHYACKTAEILPIQQGQMYQLAEFKDPSYKLQGLVGSVDGNFRGTLVSYDVRGNEVCIPRKTRELLKIDLDQSVFICPFYFEKKKEQR